MCPSSTSLMGFRVISVIALLGYGYWAFCFHTIAAKTFNKGGWMFWLPLPALVIYLLNMTKFENMDFGMLLLSFAFIMFLSLPGVVILIKIADKPYYWLLGLFVPILNIALSILIWMRC